jgi:DUF971 family protein
LKRAPPSCVWGPLFLAPEPSTRKLKFMPAVTLIQNVVIGDELALAWSDGSERYINLRKLREACPCAVCQGEPDAMGHVVKPTVTHTEKSFRALRMQQVGGYALQITWADGHSSGIYSYDLLRRIQVG